MSERLSDEQVARLAAPRPDDTGDGIIAPLAREAQEARAYRKISHEATVCREVTRQQTDTVNRLSAECDALTAKCDALRAFLTGGECDCDRTWLGGGAVTATHATTCASRTGLIEKLEAVMAMPSSLRGLGRAKVAELLMAARRMVEP